MTNKFKVLRYQKNDIDFRILTSGVSKTNVKRFIAKIPKKHFKGIDSLYFLKISDEQMYELVSHHHHTGETDFNRAYHASMYEDENSLMKIAVYITDDFYREINQNKVWIDMIRGAILHELGHHLIHQHGFDDVYDEVYNEHLVDRFVERNSDMRLLMLVSPKKIREFNEIWDRIEAQY